MDLTATIAQLPWSEWTSAGLAMPANICDVLVKLQPSTGTNAYVLDVPAIRRNPNLIDRPYADLTVEFVNSGGPMACGRLENAPDEVLSLQPDPRTWPDWLT